MMARIQAARGAGYNRAYVAFGRVAAAYPLCASFRAGDTVILLEQEAGVVVGTGIYGLG
jgi:hypothetical protein